MSDSSERGRGADIPCESRKESFSLLQLRREREISEETARLFGVGYFPGKGSMSGRVVMPIRSAAGELVAYAGRSIDNSEPKYKLPAGFKKAAVLYNLDAALKADRSRGV